MYLPYWLCANCHCSQLSLQPIVIVANCHCSQLSFGQLVYKSKYVFTKCYCDQLSFLCSFRTWPINLFGHLSFWPNVLLGPLSFWPIVIWQIDFRTTVVSSFYCHDVKSVVRFNLFNETTTFISLLRPGTCTANFSGA